MSDDRSSEGHRVRVVIRLQTPSVSSDDTHSLQLSEGERVVNGQAVSSDTSSAEFQAQLDEEVDREFQFDEGPLEMAREAKLVTMVSDATHVRTHRHRVRSVLRRVLRFKPWKWRSLVGVRREVKMPRGPRSSNEEQTPLVGQRRSRRGRVIVTRWRFARSYQISPRGGWSPMMRMVLKVGTELDFWSQCKSTNPRLRGKFSRTFR